MSKKPNKLLSLLGSFAPAVGTAIAGPAGGFVMGMLADKMGVKGDSEAALIKAIEAPGGREKLVDIEKAVILSEQKFNTGKQKIALAELNSDDKFVKRSRPSFLYGMTLVWVFQGVGFTTAMLMAVLTFDPIIIKETAAGIAAMIASFTAIWAVALSVSGAAIVKRSHDKAVAAGQAPGGIIKMLASKLT